MKTRIWLVIVVLFFGAAQSTLALEWKQLHEKADTLGVAGALVALEQDQNSLSQLYVLGLAYLNVYKNAEAKDIFERMLALSPGLAEARWGKAETLRRRHALGESEALLNETLKTAPQFLPAYVTLAYLKYLQFDFAQAQKLLQKVIGEGEEKVDVSNYVRAYCFLAGVKGMIAYYGGPVSKLVNGSAVIPLLRKAQHLQPNNPAVSFGYGSFYLLAPRIAGGNIEKALEFLEKTVRLDPLFPDAWVRLAQAYYVKGDKEKHAAFLNKALEIDPQSEIALDIKGRHCKFICVAKEE